MSGFLTAEVMSGREWSALERAVARLMSQKGWQGVQATGRSGDEGGDVVGVLPTATGRHIFAVQVKAVSPGNLVGAKAIQEALNAQSRYGADRVVVATNGEFRDTAYKRKAELVESGFDVSLWNGTFLNRLLESSPYESPQRPLQLYDYQERVLGALRHSYDSGSARALFTMATGLGKTVVAGEFMRGLIERGDVSRVLVVAHATHLVRQLEQAMWRHLGKDTPTRLMAEGQSPGTGFGVTAALWQTLHGYLPSLSSSDYDLVVVDEAHNSLGASFRRCVEEIRPKFLLVMTATPWRQDGQTLDSLFGRPVESVSIVEGMKHGYLARVDYRLLADDINWDAVPSLSRKGLGIRDLNRRLFLPQRDEACVAAIAEECAGIPDPRIIVFAERVEHGVRIADLLNVQTPFWAACLSGRPAVAQQRALAEFSAGKLQALVAVDLLNEGIDLPDVNVVVFMRRTNSRRIFVQQLGRGLRTRPGTEKTVLVLDLVSDLSRVAAILEMKRQDERIQGSESVVLPTTTVNFTSSERSQFFEEWIADMASLDDEEIRREFEYPI